MYTLHIYIFVYILISQHRGSMICPRSRSGTHSSASAKMKFLGPILAKYRGSDRGFSN